MQIGLIGLGTMGQHMALNVLKGGYQLAVHDVRKEAAGPHVAAGAVWTDSPRQVGAQADIVFTSLPGPIEVEKVGLGADGLLAGMKPDSVYVDLTTNSPTLVRRLHAEFGARGVHVLDAPVSGGPRGARTRKLALWVGGDEAIFRRHKPVLDAIGDQVIHVGPVGSGSVAKLVHNCARSEERRVGTEGSSWGTQGDDTRQ